MHMFMHMCNVSKVYGIYLLYHNITEHKYCAIFLMVFEHKDNYYVINITIK